MIWPPSNWKVLQRKERKDIIKRSNHNLRKDMGEKNKGNDVGWW